MVSFAGSSRAVSVDLSAGRWSYVTRIMALGDSITSGDTTSPGWGYRGPLWNLFRQHGLAIDFVGQYQDGPATFSDPNHQGVDGLAAHDLIPDVSSIMTRYKPNAVLLMIGSNDISAYGESPSTLRSEMRQILDKIDARLPNTTVFVSTLTPLSPDQPGSDQISAANTQIRAAVSDAVRRGEHVKLVQPNLSVSDLEDGVHPNETGYAKLAQSWYSAITHALPAQGGTPGGHAQTIWFFDTNITGSEANDRLSGNGSSNRIYGGGGDDIISGRGGNDTLYGGGGSDTLIGSTGYDTFLYRSVSQSGPDIENRDVISDFRYHDKIDLSRIDADVTQDGNQAFHIVSGFSGSAGELTWEATEKGFLVSGDVDGDGNPDFSIQVNTKSSDLHTWDFRL